MDLYGAVSDTMKILPGYIDEPNSTGRLKSAHLAINDHVSDQRGLEELDKASSISSHYSMVAPDENPNPSTPRAWIRHPTSRDYRFMNYLFCSISMKSRTDLIRANNTEDQLSFEQDDHREQHITCKISLAAWLMSFGLNQGLHLKLSNSSITGWKFALDTFRAVPDDSLIFNYCRAGDLDAVRLLLSKGQASVRDTNSYQETALYVSGIRLIGVSMSRQSSTATHICP